MRTVEPTGTEWATFPRRPGRSALDRLAAACVVQHGPRMIGITSALEAVDAAITHQTIIRRLRTSDSPVEESVLLEPVGRNSRFSSTSHGAASETPLVLAQP